MMMILVVVVVVCLIEASFVVWVTFLALFFIQIVKRLIDG